MEVEVNRLNAEERVVGLVLTRPGTYGRMTRSWVFPEDFQVSSLRRYLVAARMVLPEPINVDTVLAELRRQEWFELGDEPYLTRLADQAAESEDLQIYLDELD